MKSRNFLSSRFQLYLVKKATLPDKLSSKQVIILADVTNKPYSPETSGVEFGDAYLDNSRIEEMGGACEPVVNSSAYSGIAYPFLVELARDDRVRQAYLGL